MTRVFVLVLWRQVHEAHDLCLSVGMVQVFLVVGQTKGVSSGGTALGGPFIAKRSFNQQQTHCPSAVPQTVSVQGYTFLPIQLFVAQLCFLLQAITPKRFLAITVSMMSQ